MLLPIFRLKNIVDSLLEWIKEDFKNSGSDENSWLYLFSKGNDDQDGKFFKTAKEIFIRDELNKNSIRTAFEFPRNVVGAPCVVIREPSRVNGSGNVIGKIYPGVVPVSQPTVGQPGIDINIFTDSKRFSYDFLCVSANFFESLVVSEVLYGLMLGAYDTFAQSFQTVEFSSREITIENDLVPFPVFLRVVTVDLQCDFRAPSIIRSEYLDEIRIMGTSSLKLLSRIQIVGSTSVVLGEETQLSVLYYPSDTTQKGVTWISSDVNVASVDNNGLVRGITEGNVTITARSVVDPLIFTTVVMRVQPAIPVGSVEVLISMRDSLLNGGVYEADNITGKIINAGNVNGSTGVEKNIILYSSNGNLRNDFTIMTRDERVAATGVPFESFIQGFAPDLSAATTLPYNNGYFERYQYAWKYNSTTYPVYGLNVPNGTYRIRILSSTSRDESSANGHVAINGVEQTLPTPAFSLTNNSKNWFEFTNIAVTDGKLLIKIWAEKSRYFGINFIELLKMD